MAYSLGALNYDHTGWLEHHGGNSMSRSLAAGSQALLALLLVATHWGLTYADAPAWYKCGCKPGGARCICPSLAAPRQLSREQTPQFILLTHEGAINPNASSAMLEVTRSRKHPNGCPITATMFAYTFDLDCQRALELHTQGYEIASNGASHRSMLNMTKLQLHNELAGSRAALAKCGISERDVVGHRSPFLQTRAVVRETLQKEGFLYDSSVIELGGSAAKAASLSYGMGKRVWPFTLDFGLPTNCAALAPQQMCNNLERYSGLFEVPVWQLNALGGAFIQDPGGLALGGMNSTVRPVDMLVANFEAAYNGNRAPFPIYVHTPWLRTGQHLRGLQLFAEYALKKPHVYFVTTRQLLAWMSSPIPADQITSDNLGCGNPGGAGPTPAQVLSRPTPPAAPLAKPPPPPAPLVQPASFPPPAPQLSPPSSPPPAGLPPPAVSPSPPPAAPPPPSPSPVAAARPMPASGVRITFSFTGLSNATFWGQVAAPLRLLILHDIVSAPEDTFVASVAEVPAGTVTGPTTLMRGLPAARRALRQTPPRAKAAPGAKAATSAPLATAPAVAQAAATPQTAGTGAAGKRATWLESIVVAGGNDPLQMYYTAQSSLTDATLSSVLGQTGGQLAMPPIVVPFQDGRDLAVLRPPSPPPPPPFPRSPPVAAGAVPAPAPDAIAGGSSGASSASSSSGGGSGSDSDSGSSTSSSSSSSIPIGVIVGSAAGAAVVLVGAASLIYWRAVVQPRRRAALAALPDSSNDSKDWPDGSELAEASSDAGGAGGAHDAMPSFAAHLALEEPAAPLAAASATDAATSPPAAAAMGAAAAAVASTATAAEEQQLSSPAPDLLGQRASPVPQDTPELAGTAAGIVPAGPVLLADQPATLPLTPAAAAVGIPASLPLAPQPASAALQAIDSPLAPSVAPQAAEPFLPAAPAEAAIMMAAAEAQAPSEMEAVAAEAEASQAAAEQLPQQATFRASLEQQQQQQQQPQQQQQAALPQHERAQPRELQCAAEAAQAPLPMPPPPAPTRPKAPRYFQPPAPLGSYASGGHVVGLSAADAVYATPGGYRRAAIDQERTLLAPLQAERSPSGGFIVAPSVVGPFTPGTYSRAGSLPRGPGSAQSARSYDGSLSGLGSGAERDMDGSHRYAASNASGGSSRGGMQRQLGAYASGTSLSRSPAGSVAPPHSPSVSSTGPRRGSFSRSSTLTSSASARSEASSSQRTCSD